MSISEQLKEIEKQVIGLFTANKDPNKSTWLVIANDNNLLTCIQITPLLGLNTLHIGAEEGNFLSFVEYKTLDKLKEDFEAFKLTVNLLK